MWPSAPPDVGAFTEAGHDGPYGVVACPGSLSAAGDLIEQVGEVGELRPHRADRSRETGDQFGNSTLICRSNS